MNLLYPMEEYAKLSAFLPKEICPLFQEPYAKVEGHCLKVEGHTTILAAGGRKQWCNDCEPDKLDAYMELYHEISAVTRARGAWN